MRRHSPLPVSLLSSFLACCFWLVQIPCASAWNGPPSRSAQPDASTSTEEPSASEEPSADKEEPSADKEEPSTTEKADQTVTENTRIIDEAQSNQEQESSPKEKPAIREPGDLSFWQRSTDWLVDYRNDISSGIEGMAVGIDRFFSGEDALDDENKSYARIRAGVRLEEGEGFSQQSDFKFRLSLPATQKKLKLVIENDSDEDESLEDRNRPSRVDQGSKDEERLSAALQFFNKEANRWDSKSELGVRARTPVDIFVRHTAKRRWDIEGPWSMQFRQRWAYYKESGYRANEELNFERRIDENLFYRIKTEVEWREEVDSMRAAQIFILYHRIDDNRGIEYQAGTLANSWHHTVIDNSYLAIDYRQLLYEDWLYVDVIPEIIFPRENDYNPTSSLTVRLEVLFFE